MTTTPHGADKATIHPDTLSNRHLAAIREVIAREGAKKPLCQCGACVERRKLDDQDGAPA